MATEEGTLALLAEAKFRGIVLPAEYYALAGDAARAMWFLTYHTRLFYDARLIYTADHLGTRSSTTIAGLPTVLPPHDRNDFALFRRALREYLLLHQGRGRHCLIEPLLRGHRLLLFVHLSDYHALQVGFDGEEQLVHHRHQPVFELVFQFSHTEGTLSVYAKGSQSYRLELLDLFCRHVLGVECPSGVVRRPSFQLDHLIDRDSARPPDPAGGVVGARIRRLRVGVLGSNEWVTLETSAEGGWDDVHRMLDRHFPIMEFPREDLAVSVAMITLGHLREGKPRTLSFEVTSRGSTNLTSRSDHQQDLGEQLMRWWGMMDV